MLTEAGLPVDLLTRGDLPRPRNGIVHLGLGAFFRAFGCVYIADAIAASGGDWGVVGISLRNPATRDALRPQNWAYTSVTLYPEQSEARVIDVLNDVLVAPEDPEAVLAAMTAPEIKIVSLTVTEKGYCHIPSTGALDTDHADIAHDLSNPLPVSAIGFIVRALQRRRDAGSAPFTVLSCDNLPDNGRVVRGVVLEFARLIDPALADWIADHGRFPATMVDRITPATTQDDIARVATLTGHYDAAPVLHEPFAQWVIEDDFVDNARPDLAAAGAEMVTSVTRHENMKLKMLNGTHSALAYTGYLAGKETIADTIADPAFATYARVLWTEILPAVTPPEGVNLEEYAGALLDRYANPSIRHLTWQIAMDGSQKLPQRLLATLRCNLDNGRASPALCTAVVAWMRYVCGTDEAGNKIDVRDPHAAKLLDLTSGLDDPADIVRSLLTFDAVFPADLAARLEQPLIAAAREFWAKGAQETVEAFTE
ncbi:MAG: fructuronate reductase [Sulfitobacter sp.]|jgi:fructuronate reductase